MFSLCSLSSFISLISSLACTRQRKSRRAVYSSCSLQGTNRSSRWVCEPVLWAFTGRWGRLLNAAQMGQPELRTLRGTCLKPSDQSLTRSCRNVWLPCLALLFWWFYISAWKHPVMPVSSRERILWPEMLLRIQYYAFTFRSWKFSYLPLPQIHMLKP